MYNIGFQNSFWGRELKVTRPSNGFRFDSTYFIGLQSLSTFKMIPQKYSVKSVKLRLTRVNNEIRAYHQDEDLNWIEKKPTPHTVEMGNGVKVPINGFNETEYRPKSFGLDNNVQVGIISNPGMKVSNPLIKFRDAGSKFSYLTISKIDSFDECLL